MRLKLAREYYNRQFIIQMLPLVLIMGVSFILEFYYYPVDIVGYEPDPVALFVKRMLPLLGLGTKAFLSALPLYVAMMVIMRLGSRFVNALYGLEGEKQDSKERGSAFGRLLFGLRTVEEDVLDFDKYDDVFHRDMLGITGIALRPIMIVKGGGIAIGGGSKLDIVGGPGFLIVHHDSAVVLEREGRLTRVVGPSTKIEGLPPGISMLERFERVWEVIDLRPQRWSMCVNAMTKEGIPVSCDAQISFRIDDRFIGSDGTVHRERPTAERPYPYTDDAIVKAATGVWVRIHQRDHPEQSRKWTGRVMIGEVEGTLRNILAQYRLDWLMSPPCLDDDVSSDAGSSVESTKTPREEIREQLATKLRDVFKVDNSLGVQILEVALGEIDVLSDEVSKQWVEVWRADWKRRALESQAEGEAELTRLETARLQAQAEMVLVLTDAIRPLVRGEGDFPPYLFAMRLVQTLRWLAYDPTNRPFLSLGALRGLDALERALNLKYAGGIGEASEGLESQEDPWQEFRHLLAERDKR